MRASLGRAVRPGGPKPTPIIPRQNVAGRALTLVIAIMTFLCCLTTGAVSLVADAATRWQSQIAREATIQIRPGEDFDMAEALQRARTIAAEFPGVIDTQIIDDEETSRLLEPWLGTGLDLSELPVPRLILLTIDETSPPDFPALRAALTAEIENLSLDDHRSWVDRLVKMAGTTIVIGITVLVMMIIATILTVVFATRGAMAGNDPIIEVLHFVGAEARFIAREFRRHFLLIGLRGAVTGGGVALLIFGLFHVWSLNAMATPEGDQTSALFGNFAIGLTGWLGVGGLIIMIAALTAITSHVTVLNYLGEMDRRALEQR
ncbi:cell division protein FtsX [Notoacmeibacter ruber]|nr:ABC transporter permease [Notoacmeibacter ruber]